MEIRVIKAPEGVLPELMPEVGAVYRATKSVRRPGNQQYPEFCWIELKGKKIVLRKGEYEIVAEDPPEEETMHKEQEQEKTPAQEALPAAKPPQKREPKQKAETDLMPPGHAAHHAAGGASGATGRADGGAGQEQPPGAGAAGPHPGALR